MENKQVQNIMDMPVDVICYGERKHYETRAKAVQEFFEAMNVTEGAEKSRYAMIYSALVGGSADIVTDGSSERIKSKSVAKYTVADKDKIIKLIEAGKLSINSREIYDIGKCELVVEDRDIIKALLKQDGWYAAQFLRKYIENDKELIMAVSLGGEETGRGLAYAGAELCDDKEFVLQLLVIDASDFQYVSDRLANDVEVVSVALSHAVDDYDMCSIKENIGTKLLVEMVERQEHLAEIIQKDEYDYDHFYNENGQWLVISDDDSKHPEILYRTDDKEVAIEYWDEVSGVHSCGLYNIAAVAVAFPNLLQRKGELQSVDKAISDAEKLKKSSEKNNSKSVDKENER